MNEKAIYGEVIVSGSVEEVWNAWTTESGVKSFLAPDCKIDLKPEGSYEIYFDPDAPEGSRGGEGLKVLWCQTGDWSGSGDRCFSCFFCSNLYCNHWRRADCFNS